MPPFFAHDLELETTRAHTNKIVMFAAVLLVDRNPLQIEKLKTQLKPKSFRNQKKTITSYQNILHLGKLTWNPQESHHFCSFEKEFLSTMKVFWVSMLVVHKLCNLCEPELGMPSIYTFVSGMLARLIPTGSQDPCMYGIFT